MSSLIFFIFMIWFIMRIVKNKQKATGQNDPKQTQGSNTPGSAATRTGSTYSTAAGRAKKSAYESARAFKRPQPDQGQAAVHPVWATAPLALTAVHRLLLPQRRIWNGKRRRMPGIMRGKARGTGASPSGNRRTYGRRAVLGVGQHSRRGNRVVKCNYCGAENLISERYKPNRYTCYFCREILE